MIKLRPATFSDTERLFAWRNDPTTYAHFWSAKPVTFNDHLVFMQTVLSHPEHSVWIAEKERVPIGMVRFTPREVGDEVSITMAPEYRGQGLGYLVLSMATRDPVGPDLVIRPPGPLFAKIKRTNTASRRIFEQCYFEEEGGDEDFVLYKRGSS